MTDPQRIRVNILGVKVDPLELKDVLSRVEEFIVSGEKRTVLYANVYCINVAGGDPEYRNILNQADLVYCDGYGVVLGARITGGDIPERMTGADWIFDLGSFCQEKGYSVFLLGSRPGVSERAAHKLRMLYPSLEISGMHHGYLTDHEKVTEAIEIVNSKRPDILLVGMGSPIQEKFISHNRGRIDAPVCWAVGALFDFTAGIVPRAPRWMLNNGLEWLFRLLYEPGRMWNRYLVGNTRFLARVIIARLRKISSQR